MESYRENNNRQNAAPSRVAAPTAQNRGSVTVPPPQSKKGIAPSPSSNTSTPSRKSNSAPASSPGYPSHPPPPPYHPPPPPHFYPYGYQYPYPLPPPTAGGPASHPYTTSNGGTPNKPAGNKTGTAATSNTNTPAVKTTTKSTTNENSAGANSGTKTTTPPRTGTSATPDSTNKNNNNNNSNPYHYPYGSPGAHIPQQWPPYPYGHPPPPPYYYHAPISNTPGSGGTPGRYWGPPGSQNNKPLSQKTPSLPPRPANQPLALIRPKPSARKTEVSGNKPKGAREMGATSPTQIETHHRDFVQTMGCTCKRTRCLKLYCQCFGVKIHCGDNCRCLDCYNSGNHESERKEAMRSILSRNPLAFDTKFRKDPNAPPHIVNGPSNGPITPVTYAGPAGPTVAAEESRTTAAANASVAHRLGCKCRKSACMKKYCECYAGNVLCSNSCRCMGCKNIEGGKFKKPTSAQQRRNGTYPAMGPYQNYPPRPYIPPPPPVTHRPLPATLRKCAEPWQAAKSLTFLKRGSSTTDSNPTSPDANTSSIKAVPPENSSMPSLASSSDGNSPGEVKAAITKSASSYTPEKLFNKTDTDDSLLLVAVAMTEFGQSPPPSSTKELSVYSSELSIKNTKENLLPSSKEKKDTLQHEDDRLSSSKRSINFDSDTPTGKQKKIRAEDSAGESGKAGTTFFL